MRVLLKKGDNYRATYYVKRKKANNCIVGWFTEKRLLEKMFPEINTFQSDIHFTYPADGNYHISFKYKNSSNEMIERRIFNDKIIIKNITQNKKEIIPKSAINVFEGHLNPNHGHQPSYWRKFNEV